MNHSTCLITGCEFLDVEQRRWIHGDLYQLVDSLILDASGCHWSKCDEVPLDPEAFIVICPVHYEKGSQVVFPLALAQFNAPANKFLNDNMGRILVIPDVLKS